MASRWSRDQWETIYREAWSIYYTPKHMETLLRRAVANGVPVNSLIKVLVNFATTVRLENVHPLQGGILRLKHPFERRPGLPRERTLVFWPRFAWETLSKHAVIIAMIARLLVLKFVITRDAAARTYQDTALTPVGDGEAATLALLTNTTGAHVAHSKKIARLDRNRSGCLRRNLMLLGLDKVPEDRVFAQRPACRA